MISRPVVWLIVPLLFGGLTAAAVSHAAEAGRSMIESAVVEAIRPVMKDHGVPGMAVGVVTRGGSHVFNYGVVSREAPAPVTDETLFEIGSISKTFTATLAAYAEATGHLSLSDKASKELPALAGSAFDQVSLMHLATHTQGGLPLQFPQGIGNEGQLIAYYKAWKPTYAPGTHRTYSNPGIGLLGVIAARSMKADFTALMEGKLFPALGLQRSYLNVPAYERKNYAQGYTKADRPARMSPGMLAAEAYGVRSTAGDMARFLAANMQQIKLGEPLRQAIAATHVGYYRAGAMTQALIWEHYPYPTELKDLLAGNSASMSLKANAVTAIDPPLAPGQAVLINKTGSTSGFAAYAAFIPAKGLGIVLLANKNYPAEARVTAAHRILTRLDAEKALRD